MMPMKPRLRLVDRDVPPAASRRTTRVLIAAGQALVRAGLRAVLESAGAIIVAGEATTGDEAVALAHRTRPDVVVIDATLPGLDCVEAARRMLADSGTAVMLFVSSE